MFFLGRLPKKPGKLAKWGSSLHLWLKQPPVKNGRIGMATAQTCATTCGDWQRKIPPFPEVREYGHWSICARPLGTWLTFVETQILLTQVDPWKDSICKRFFSVRNIFSHRFSYLEISFLIEATKSERSHFWRWTSWKSRDDKLAQKSRPTSSVGFPGMMTTILRTYSKKLSSVGSMLRNSHLRAEVLGGEANCWVWG